MSTNPLSWQTVGDAQQAVSVTENTKAVKQSTTPTCSSNGTHSDGYTGAFEGPEKLLEMWFAPSAQAAQVIDQADKLCDEDLDQWSELRNGLRCVPRAVWREMLELVHCQVLSTLCNEHLDSYLLSESSFFVYPHKLVLKTCGTTTLLYAIPRILEIARSYLGVVGVYQVFYSRKNFMFPDQQEETHRSWEKEVTFLDAFFPEGSAYLIGKTNRDHWHVYLSGPYDTARLHEAAKSADMLDGALLEENALDSEASDSEQSHCHCHDRQQQHEQQRSAMNEDTLNNSMVGSPRANPISRSSSHSTVNSFVAGGGPSRAASCASESSTDTTVEILMTGLDPDRMRLMYIDGIDAEEGARGGKAVERASGISAIYPESASDSFLFSPCGFSLNGLQDDGYYTIHVTPEPHCSYASFETNVSSDQALDLLTPEGIKSLVEQVANVFGPRCLTVTVFKSRADTTSSGVGAGHAGSEKDMLKAVARNSYEDIAPPSFAPVDGYKAVDRVLYEFDHYWLRYGYYLRAD
ncbi:spermidine resistance protein [Dipsacomyces acuminosporus]|nr:spermidine resistance protein [Dipsacomyces acuminosporus]